MSIIHRLENAYRNADSLITNGIELVVVPDPIGHAINDAARELHFASFESGNPGFAKKASEIAYLARWLWTYSVVSTQSQHFLFELEELCNQLPDGDLQNPLIRIRDEVERILIDGKISPMLETLLDDVSMFGEDAERECRVATVKGRAALDIGNMVQPNCAISTVEGMRKAGSSILKCFFLGEPMRFSSSSWTAPIAKENAFYLPDWVRNRDLPVGELEEVTNTPSAPVRIFDLEAKKTIEISPSEVSKSRNSISEDSLSAEEGRPVETVERGTGQETELALRVGLGGGRSVFLRKDGEIRVLEFDSRGEITVDVVPVSLLEEGDFIHLRSSGGDPLELETLTRELLSARWGEIAATQQEWKAKLEKQYDNFTDQTVANFAAMHGIVAHQQLRMWTDARFIHPRSDSDFRALLKWLRIEDWETTFENAKQLRGARQKAGHKIARDLSNALQTVASEIWFEKDWVDLEGVEDRNISGAVARVRNISRPWKPEPQVRSRLGQPFFD